MYDIALRDVISATTRAFRPSTSKPAAGPLSRRFAAETRVRTIVHTSDDVDHFEWDPEKAASNFRKHGIRFVEAVSALQDQDALTRVDPDAGGEQRLVSLGIDAFGRLLVTVFTVRNLSTRMISSRHANAVERRAYSEP